MRTDANGKALKPEVQKMLDDVHALGVKQVVAEKKHDIKYERERERRFNMPPIPHSREKTVLDDLLKNYKNKISCMRAIMRLPKSEIRDVAMAAILEAFTK